MIITINKRHFITSTDVEIVPMVNGVIDYNVQKVNDWRINLTTLSHISFKSIPQVKQYLKSDSGIIELLNISNDIDNTNIRIKKELDNTNQKFIKEHLELTELKEKLLKQRTLLVNVPQKLLIKYNRKLLKINNWLEKKKEKRKNELK